MREHIEELAARKGGWHYLLLALEENPRADEASFEALAHVVDRVTFHEISAGEDIRRELGSFLKTQDGDVAGLMTAWTDAISAAEPSRDAIRVLLSGFPRWTRTLSANGVGAFGAVMPVLAPFAAELKDEGVQAVVSILSDTVASTAAVYRESSGEIILAAARIVHIAPGEADRMATIAAPEKIFEIKEGEKLLPAIAAAGAKHGADAVELCLNVAEQSFSSAVHVAGKVAGIAQVPRGYLDAFNRIVKHAGISMVRFGLKQLPERFEKNGVESTLRFVDQGVAIGKRYGQIAAQEFFEEKTAAARGARF